MTKYLAFLAAGALIVGIVVDARADGDQAMAWGAPMLVFMVAGMWAVEIAWRPARIRDDHALRGYVDARIDGFVDIEETLAGRPLCNVHLTVHWLDDDDAQQAYRTTAVTLRDIRTKREVGDELSVVRQSPDRPDVDIVGLAHLVHEFGPYSVAPGVKGARHEEPSPLGSVPVTGETSRRPWSASRAGAIVAACLSAFVLGAACWWWAVDSGSIVVETFLGLVHREGAWNSGGDV